ncbi:MAG: cyclic nucleotide-binding/CBS domain-containing protein [Austwickia sp.]|jgi:CBS domain-containing protein|nr:MAG: cyclic nucleotide-binding/CBS domain-containing protein [Austwickia sp.]
MGADVELAEVRDFIAGVAPFDTLPAAVLDALPRSMTMQYFRRGTAIMAVGRNNDELYVVRSGAVDVLNQQGRLVDRGGVGTCFGSTTLVRGNPSRFDVTAIEDVLALVLPAADFHALAQAHEGFARFFDSQRASRMSEAAAAIQASETGSSVFKARARDLIRQPASIVSVDTSIQGAAQQMTDDRRSSALVMLGRVLAGIVTDRDLRSKVVAQGVDVAEAVHTIMTPSPVTADADAVVFEVLLDMVSRNIHHMPITEAGQPIGVLTTNDIVRVEQDNPLFLTREIAAQESVAGIVAVAHRLPGLVETLVRQDASADEIGRVVTAVGDAVDRRLILLAEAELGPPPIPYCWVVMGSRARLEQALGADQDNALILDDSYDEARHGAYFQALAESVCGALAEAGYAHCPGKVMASNDRLRAPVRVWRQQFDEWMTRPVADAILRAGIFFDMRPVHGAIDLYAALSDHVAAVAPQSRLFLGHMTRGAVGVEPPIGFFRGLVVAKQGEHRDTFDIKGGGVRAVVEVARVIALSNGIRAVNTRQRLQEAIDTGAMDRHRGEDLRDAFEFISYVRLRHQAGQVRAGQQPDNHVRPDDLTEFDQRHLREAFAIVSKAQRTLSHLYSVSFMR